VPRTEVPACNLARFAVGFTPMNYLLAEPLCPGLREPEDNRLFAQRREAPGSCEAVERGSLGGGEACPQRLANCVEDSPGRRGAASENPHEMGGLVQNIEGRRPAVSSANPGPLGASRHAGSRPVCWPAQRGRGGACSAMGGTLRQASGTLRPQRLLRGAGLLLRPRWLRPTGHETP